MQLSLRRIGDQNLYYKESGRESSLQLVFLPGSLNAEMWKNQIRYFSKKYNTVVFEPIEKKKSFEGEKDALRAVLNQDHLENVVLVSNIISNSLLRHFEHRKNVKAVCMTGKLSEIDLPPKSVYKFICSTNTRKPKLLKKTLFSEHTNYRILKEFAEDVEVPSYEYIENFFQNMDPKPIEKPSITVYSSEDRLSSLKSVREVEEDESIRVLERCGTFSFYEKPQEYNKALNDFLTKIDQELEDERIFEAQEKNHSLFEFEKKKNKKIKVRP